MLQLRAPMRRRIAASLAVLPFLHVGTVYAADARARASASCTPSLTVASLLSVLCSRRAHWPSSLPGASSRPPCQLSALEWR
jgi:hypothetical protein